MPSVQAAANTAAGPADLRPERPNKLARIIAAAIVSTLVAAITTRLLGRRAGFVAMAAAAAAHEVIDEPLAGVIGRRFRLMTV